MCVLEIHIYVCILQFKKKNNTNTVKNMEKGTNR